MLKIIRKGALQQQDDDCLSIAHDGNIIFQAHSDSKIFYLNIYVWQGGENYEMIMHVQISEAVYCMEQFKVSDKIYFVLIYDYAGRKVVVYKVDISMKSVDKFYQNINHNSFQIVKGVIFEHSKNGQLLILMSSNNDTIQRILENIYEMNVIQFDAITVLKTITQDKEINYYSIPDLCQLIIQERPSRVSKRLLTLLIQGKRSQEFYQKLEWMSTKNDHYSATDLFGKIIIYDIHKVIVIENKMIYIRKQKILRHFRKNYCNQILADRYIITSGCQPNSVCNLTTAQDQLIDLCNVIRIVDGYLVNHRLEILDNLSQKQHDDQVIYKVDLE